MSFKENQSQGKNDSEIIVKWSTNANAPLIMLFGWAGCRDRYLSKYSEIYEAKKYSILRFTVPISKVNCYSSYRQFAFQIYDKVLNLSAEEIKFPIFFHVFSMNGCSLFSSLWDFLSLASNGKAVKQAVKGIIFDSFSVLRFTTPVQKVRSYESHRYFAVKVFERLINAFDLSNVEASSNVDQFPSIILIQMFSMNGCSLFSHFWAHLNTSDIGKLLKRSIKGVIFDSCPADMLPWDIAGGITLGAMPFGSSIVCFAYKCTLAAVFSARRSLIWLRSNFENNAYANNLSYYHLLQFNDLPKDQLYLYSLNDWLCRAESIESFIKTQKQKLKYDDVQIVSHCWKDSQHVSHFYQHKKLYTQECLKFVNQVKIRWQINQHLMPSTNLLSTDLQSGSSKAQFEINKIFSKL